MKLTALALPATLAALALAGCSSNALNQPAPGQTPASVNPQTPAYGQAGGSLVPANDPNANKVPATPAGGPQRVYAPPLTPEPPGGQGPQQGYFGTADQPLVPPNPAEK